MKSALERLEEWYHKQCDGDWEHQYGVTIQTVDNPGWMVAIDLTETDCVREDSEVRRVSRSESDWFEFRVWEGKILGRCGPANLSELVEAFIDILSDP